MAFNYNNKAACMVSKDWTEQQRRNLWNCVFTSWKAN